MDPSNDAALVREFLGGNKDAFGKLYEKYVKAIYNFIYYKTHHKETAEDLVSQTFMKAMKSAGSFDAEKGTYSAWMYSIARNVVIDHYRSVRPSMNIEDAWDLGSGDDLDRDVDCKLQIEKVQKYLKELSPEQRDIVILRVWQQLSYAEIAAIMGKSEAGCKMTFSRTIHKLRDSMPAAVFALMVFFPELNSLWK